MFDFTYHVPVKVYFGKEHLPKLGEELKAFGKKVLLVYGGGSVKTTGLYDRVAAEIKAAELELYELGGVEPNPRVTTVNRGAALCKEQGIDVVLAVGGGSTIDAAKAIAGAACYDGDAWDLIVQKAPIEAALPLVSILTLAATGSEMNGTAVISNLDTGDKIGMASPWFLPKVSFLDPTNTFTVNRYQTAAGAADILSHVMETYFTPTPAMAMLDEVMEGLMRTVLANGPLALAEPDNYEARANLMWASSWAINGFIRGDKRQSWSCHAMEHPLSAYYDITHGLGLAIITPHWLRHVLSEATEGRIRQFAVRVFGVDEALAPRQAAEEGIRRLEKFFFEDLGLVSTLSEAGIDDNKLGLMAEKACRTGVINGFTVLTPTDVEEIYRKSL